MHTTSSAQRKRLITLIQIAKSQLKLDETLYRTMLKPAVAKDSLRAMNLSELEQALAAFKQKGFKPSSNTNKTGVKKRLSPKSGKAKITQIDKIRAVWITMGHHNIVQDSSETALDAYVRRMTNRTNKVDSIAWLDEPQAYRVLESLKNWHKRELIERIKQRGTCIPTNEKGSPLGYSQTIDLYLNGAYGGAAHEH